MADVHGVAPAGSEYTVAPGDGHANDTIQMSAYAKNHCKNCQMPLVEGGRAYELGGYRWHVECFRCSICSSQMDADTNMLVLGNGTLVCHNCSYFCAICQKKIEDLAILTNDQAFCADCFVCRNCQRRIDDLKYARTSQGIFCMSCHNALMARKQRKAAAAAAIADTPTGSTAGSPAVDSNTSRSSSSTQHRLSSLQSRDKDLPVLPPSTSRTTSSDRPPTLRTQSDTGSGSRIRSELPPPITPQQPNVTSHRHTRSVGDGEFVGPTDRVSQAVPPEITAPSPPMGVSDSFAAELDSFGTEEWGLDMPKAPEQDLPPTVLGVPIQLDSPPSRSPNRSPERQAAAPDRSSPSVSEGSIYSPRAMPPVSPSPRRPMRSPTRSPNRSPTRPLIDEVPLLATPNGQPKPKAWTQNTPGTVTAAAPSPSAFAAIERTPHSVSSSRSAVPSDNREFGIPREELAVPFRSTRRTASPNRIAESTSSMSIAASLSPRTWARPGPEMPAAEGGSEIDASGLMQALIRSRERISELEHLLERELQTSKMAAAAVEDPAELSRHIFERRQTLAGLEAQQKVASEELRATRDGADAEDFFSALNKHKTELQGEIESLTTERDSLRAQVTELVAKRDQALEESSILNTKNSQLVDMNNELLKQTIEKYGPNTLWSSGLTSSNGPSSSTTANSVSPVPSRDRKQRVKRKDVAAPDLDFGVPYSGSTGSQERLVDSTPKSPQSARYPGSDNLVTVLDAPTQKQRKNLWPFRRPGKGLTRVFAQEVTVGDVDSQAVTVLSGNSGPTLPSSSSTAAVSAIGTAPGGQPMLGELLEARCAMDQTPVPKIVTRCLSEVEKRGLDMEGIYRKSGSKLQIDQILGYFESNSEFLENDLEKDISAVTSAVKQYLRYLADPIIPYAQYNAYVQAGRKHDLSELYVVVKNLPPAHYTTLEAIVQHLALVAANENKNLMSSRNLAVVFAPTLARDQTGEREVADMQARNDATQMLIDNHDMFE